MGGDRPDREVGACIQSPPRSANRLSWHGSLLNFPNQHDGHDDLHEFGVSGQTAIYPPAIG